MVKLARQLPFPAQPFTFLPDESAIVCSCGGMRSGQITIVPLGSGDPRSIPWPLNVKMAAVHPNGRAVVVVDDRNRLSVLDLPSGQIERTLFVGGVRIPIEARFLLGNDYPRDWLTMPLDAIEDLLRESEMRSPRPTAELCSAVRPRAPARWSGNPQHNRSSWAER